MTDTPPVLDATQVEGVFLACLFRDSEDTSGHVRAEGVVQNVGFHPARLEEAREQVRSLLNELPDQFHAQRGGGWSFLNACNDRHGRQWGQHPNMEQLFQLGIGLGMARKLTLPGIPVEMMPGGVPYFVVDTRQTITYCCSWCGKPVTERDADAIRRDPDVTKSHGICGPCQRKHFPELEGPEATP